MSAGIRYNREITPAYFAFGNNRLWHELQPPAPPIRTRIKNERTILDINRKSSLILPKEQGNEEVIFSKSIIVVGSNGSGKSRLGTWIETESPQRDKVHRISAQKSLVMPDESKPVSIDIAQNALLYGQPATGDFSSEHKAQGKYDGKPPALAQLDDYSQLMVYLFSEHIEASAKYVAG